MNKIELKDFLNYKFLSGIELSPDSNKVAFAVHQCIEKDNSYRSNIHIYNRKYGTSYQLTGIGDVQKFIWMDNETILFPAIRDNSLKTRVEAGEPWTCYYAIKINGGEAQEYMRIPMKVLNIVPIDADKFAVTCIFKNDELNLNEYEGDEKEKVLIEIEESKDYEIADEIPFRHNGTGFHNGRRDRLYIFDRRDSSMIPVTDEWQNVELVEVQGTKVLYTAMHFYKEKRMGLTTGIYTYDIETKDNVQLLDEEIYRIRYCGYMDDKVVFAASDMKTYGPNENPFFYRIEDGKVKLIAEYQGSACNSVGSDCRYGNGATFRIFGDGIYFLSTEGGNALIKKVSLDGKFETLTEANGTVDCFDICTDEIIFIGLKGNRLQELYSCKDGVEKRLTSFNEWVQETKKISTPERFEFDNGVGSTIEGWVIKPIDFNPKEKYPAILDIHGGHKCAYGSVFYHEMQLWANEGYFVFYCNPRGSDGGGNYFAEIINKYGEIDYYDIMKFTDEVLEKYPQIEAELMAVTGGSYGGYMTNWVIGHTDRFKCAASQRSISNWISQFGTADTGYYFPMNAFVSNIWDDTEEYWFHSPLKYANKVKTPTLFIHSECDLRCPIEQGIQMFTALKYNGVESRICIFKGENHELSRNGKPRHRVKRLTEITNWFNKHLK